MNPTENEKVEKEENIMENTTAKEESTSNVNDENQMENSDNAQVDTDNQSSKENEELQHRLTEAENKIADMQDKYLRLSAEFDNYRKRTMKEKAEIIKTAAEKTITAILPVLDDMERAIANMQKSDDATALLEGIKLINNKFMKILNQEGLNKIETEGADFDTDFHEAIAMIPAPSEDLKGKVLDCVQTGYKLNDKVIRHAKVAVAQ